MPKTTIAETILRQKYKWRIPVFNADADTVGEIFESIEERDGVLSPSAVVDEARPEVSPIHACFEWDDEKAAEKYRETQASSMIRCLIVSTEHIENAPEGQGATILSLYFVTLNGILALFISPLSGALFDWVGAYPLYIIAAAGTFLAWLALVISQQKPAVQPQVL